MRTFKAFTVLFFITGAALMATPVLAKDSPYSNFNFTVVIDGATLGGFSEVSGLHKVSDITLKRGIIAGNTELWDWAQKVVDGNINDAHKSCGNIMFDKDSQPVAEREFENAWPSRIAGPIPSEDSTDVAMEELALANEYLVRV
jgi:hypothetical protein